MGDKVKLSEAERKELRWMVRVNCRGVGLYGPTVLQSGPLPELSPLINKGLARIDPGKRERHGYWITEEGRAALAQEDGDG